MDSCTISYQKAGMLAPITRDYIEGKAALKPYFAFNPDLNGIKKAVENRSKKQVNREVLVSVLKKQYKDSENSNAVDQNIDSLLEDRTFTVTTGHQLNLFTGPLYFVWKILSAVNLAEKLNNECPDKHFVPVYWPAGEDHDFEEVNHTYVNGKKYTWETDQSGAVGRFDTVGIDRVLSELEKDIKHQFPDQKPLEELRDAMRENNYGKAVMDLVHRWFGKYGLVIVNADHPDLKAQFTQIAERDLSENKANEFIEHTADELLEKGYKKQVTPRKVNLFYLTDNTRERIIKNGQTYSIANTGKSFTNEEIIEELRAHPERFSPNVALRPMYQETILPNVAYIGGGAEAAYWLELKTAFEAYDVFYPAVLPRNSVLVLTDRALKKKDQLKLSIEDLFRSEHELAKRVVTDATDKILSFQEEKAELKGVFAKIKKRMAESDETLRASAQAAEVKHLHYINNLEKKLLRAEKKNNKVILDRIKALKEEVYPGGVLQERRENIFTLYTLFGTEIIEEVRRKLNPLKFELTIVYK